MRKVLPRRVGSMFRAVLTAACVMRAAVAVDVNVAWDASPDAAAVSSYNLYLSLTPMSSGGQPSLTAVSNRVGNITAKALSLLPLTRYYVGVTAESGGEESLLSNVIEFTTPDGLLPGPDPGTNPNPTNNPGPGPGPGPSEPGPTEPSPSDLPTQMSLLSLLPRLTLSSTGGTPNLTVHGVVGATFTVQVATNMDGFQQWITVTNIPIATLDPDSPPAGGNALARAFEPGLETFADPSTNSAGIKFYRIYMPMGFAVVADQVLRPKGYNTRLVVVRLPGLNNYTVCYVTEEGVYLDYNDETFLIKTIESGPTIREVATKVAEVLQQNWTSASEFTVTDGLKQILATVVQTDPPSNDPPLGSPGGVSIAIDF